jgi:NAD-dependent dihydropyrimidine dehydrogenase PreA subunit/phosphohistidine swiveling domain-containing protein
MKRKIIEIDQEKCNGCGACADACHEGAIAMVDGKAQLMRDDYCDGLGDCLPACPTEAIRFVEREAAAYDEAAVLESKARKEQAASMPHAGCPGTRAQAFNRPAGPRVPRPAQAAPAPEGAPVSQLSQWPVQIKLANPAAPYFDDAKLLVAADCTAFARADFHERFIKNHITLIGCPKLDMVDYSEKLGAIIAAHDIKSVTVVRMEVPCCGGIEQAVKKALMDSGKMIPWQVVTVSISGEILDD